MRMLETFKHELLPEVSLPSRSSGRKVQFGCFILSVVVLVGVWSLSERYFHATAEQEFEFDISEHLHMLDNQISEGSLSPREAAARVTAYRDDFRVEITDARGRILYRSPDFGEYASQYTAERKNYASGEPWELHYRSTSRFDADHASFYPILFAVAGMIVQLLLLYVLLDLLRSRRLARAKTAELETSLDWLDALLTSSSDGIHILDEQGRLVAFSPSFLNQIGYSADEAKGLGVSDWEMKFAPEAIPGILASIAEQPMTIENIFRRKDGGMLDVEISAHSIVREGRRYIYAASREITERKRVEQALRREKETAQNYLDIVDVMIVVLDLEYNVRLINRKGCEMTGYASQELLGRNWIDQCVSAPLRETVRAAVGSLFGDEIPAYREYPILTKEGDERLIAWRNQPLEGVEGLSEGVLCSGEDITEMRRAQKRLRESESFYKSIFGSLNEAIIILEHTTILDCNAVAEELLDTEREALVGADLAQMAFDTECRECTFLGCLEMAYARGTARTECSWHFENGESKIVDLTLSRFGSEDEHKVILLLRDVTQQSEEERLFKMYTRQAQMGEMISMIAHQWRQPLAIINAITSQMRLKALMSEGMGDERLIDNLVKIEEQSSHLSQTISDYRDFFRPDKPKERFRVSALLHNALNLIDHTLKNHSIRIETELVRDPVLYTYRNEMLQVMMALLKNAMDAFLETKRKEGCRIVLRVDCDGPYAVLTLRDNAGGIAPETIKKLFTPYFTTKQQHYGTGLGLYMSKIVIHEHGDGTIDVQSHGDETVVTIKLPYHNEEDHHDV